MPAALVMTELTKHIPEEAISEVQTRQDRSCTFYVHSDFVDTVLRASGQGNVFVKETVPTSEFHLLWLDEEVSLADASTMATDKACFGIAREKRSCTPQVGTMISQPGGNGRLRKDQWYPRHIALW